MAIVRGTNAGFVTEAPSADPAGSAGGIDAWRAAQQDTTPADVNVVTEIGWWCDNATEEANFEVGIYSHDAVNDEPDNLIGKANAAKGTTAGWKKVTGLSIAVEPETIYWIAIQVDNTATVTNANRDNSAGADAHYTNGGQTELPENWGTSANQFERLVASYAVVESSGGSITKIVNETINISEVKNYIRGRLRIQNEIVNIVESKNYTRDRLRIISEVLNIGEAKNYLRTLLRIVNEILNISELKNKLRTLVRVKNEVINIGESFVKTIGGKLIKVINEIINISETKIRLLNRLRIINEAINIGELKNKISGILRIKNEVINLAESKNFIRSRFRVINEALNITEAKNKLRTLLRIKNETVNIGESKNKSMVLLRIKNEFISITELRNISKTILRVINEVVHATENIVHQIGIIIIAFPRNFKRVIIKIRDIK